MHAVARAGCVRGLAEQPESLLFSRVAGSRGSGVRPCTAPPRRRREEAACEQHIHSCSMTVDVLRQMAEEEDEEDDGFAGVCRFICLVEQLLYAQDCHAHGAQWRGEGGGRTRGSTCARAGITPLRCRRGRARGGPVWARGLPAKVPGARRQPRVAGPCTGGPGASGPAQQAPHH